MGIEPSGDTKGNTVKEMNTQNFSVIFAIFTDLKQKLLLLETESY